MDALILTYWIDTNGQNVRYMRAAERWGTDPGVTKAFAVGQTDPAGVVGRFALAADKLGGLKIRSAHRAEAYFEYPRDLLWDHHTDALVRELAREADILHLNNSDRAYTRLRLRTRPPVLLHHHGTAFRNRPQHFLELSYRQRWLQAVSTVDLMAPDPDVLHWLPTAYDLGELAVIGRENKRTPDGIIRVATAPWSLDSGAKWKSTPAFEAAIAQLKAEGLPVESVVITGKPWKECLADKAACDIYFDQVILGYGCNAIESWGMGQPVIAGADPWTLNKMREVFNGPLPFYEATEQTIAKAIKALVLSPDLRAEWAAKGLAHAQKFHAEKPALARLAELYMQAIKMKGPTEVRVAAPLRPPAGRSWGQMQEEARAKARQARQEARRAARIKEVV